MDFQLDNVPELMWSIKVPCTHRESTSRHRHAGPFGSLNGQRRAVHTVRDRRIPELSLRLLRVYIAAFPSLERDDRSNMESADGLGRFALFLCHDEGKFASV